MVHLESPAPEFHLPNVDGKMVGLSDFAHCRGLVVMFICNHCPYVKHINHELVHLAQEYLHKGIGFVAINSNDYSNPKYAEDSPEHMKAAAREHHYPFPYLCDSTQEVARAYDAACTPDFFVYDKARRLAYRGRMDGSTPGNGVRVNGEDLRRALDALLAERPISKDQKPSMGCNIKWKPQT
jgi:peroxiredoxin